MKRKTFISIIFRSLIVSALVAMTGVFVFRNNKNGTKQACDVSAQCASCKKISACSKPEAVEYKKSENGGQ